MIGDNIPQVQLADVAGALSYRQGVIDKDNERRKEIATNQLAGQALSAGLKEGTPLYNLAIANPQAYVSIAKTIGIDPADGSGMHQMATDSAHIAQLMNVDDSGQLAAQYMQTEADRRNKLGVQSDYLTKGLQHLQENPNTFKNAIAMASKTFNPPEKSDLVKIGVGEKVLDPSTNKIIADNPKSQDMNAFEQAQVRHWNKMDSSSTSNGGLSGDAIELAVDRLLQGEQSRDVLANFGRGAQGAAAITAVQNRLAQKSKELGVDASQILQGVQNVKADNRTFVELGAREGKIAPAVQEAQNFAQIALDASDKVPRDKFVPWNKLKNMSESQMSDPDLAAFKAANTSLINAYARAVGGGTVTVHGQEEGEKMLSTATDNASYKAVVAQILKETQGALHSPSQVRESLHNNSTNNAQPTTSNW